MATDETTTRGNVAQAIFERVSELEKADPSMSKSAIFDQIASERGGKAGTVAANYYRIARMQGTVSGAPRGRQKTDGSVDLTKYADAVQKALDDLRGAIAQNEAEKAALKESAEFGASIRAAIEKANA